MRCPFALPFALAVVFAAASSAPAESAAIQKWPGWRGDGSGISSETDLPVYWSATQNVEWKAPLPAGNSSPVIWGDRIFLTAWADAGAKRMVICLDAKDGRIVWQKDLAADRVAKTYEKNGFASSTCVTDGKRVFAFFDSPGLVAFDMDGNGLWKRDLGPFKTDWGMAASPILYKDLVIMNCDQDDGRAFIVAVTQEKGEERWRTPRPEQVRQYATPLVINAAGKDQLVVNGGTVVSYNHDDGKEIWRCRGMIFLLTPSAILSGDLVVVTSGRNGPTMAIDPSGLGDVTETHVRWHVPTGGPYVPSPLAGRFCVLPGDNGAMKFINLQTGLEAAQARLPDHFTSSPVSGGGLIYWTSEKGDVFVIELSRGDKPKVSTRSVNPMGEKVLASPAIAGGRIFIRGEKHLFCIAGGRKTTTAVAAAPVVRKLDEIIEAYNAHKEAPEGPDVALRLDLIEQCVGRKEPEVFEFLKTVAQKDNHWDVSEAAVKALCTYDKAAVPAMIDVYKTDWRPYLKISPAHAFARLKAPEAVPTLLGGMGDNDAAVRLENLQALAQISASADVQTPDVLRVCIAALGDREGIVRRAAAQSLAVLGGKLGDQRDAVVAKLLDLAADKNPLVRPTAMDVLKALKVSEEIVMRDVVLYGEQRREPVVYFLNAGPIRVKFQDGELRYLCVGDKEIVRRIYFGVRDERWDTVMPEFTAMNVQKQENSFRITMNAVSANDVADFRWNAEITGTPEGKITFKASGQAGRPFVSYRIGICVLYGAGSLAGQAFEVIDDKGAATPGVFPLKVSPTHPADNFRTLRYTTADGMEVACGVADGKFDMEDQRQFGDSSYKAYTAIPYEYPNVPKDKRGEQTVTLEMKNAKPQPAAAVRVALGEPLPGAKLPVIAMPSRDKKPGGFMSYYDPKRAEEQKISFAYNPAAHMPDDDTFMENAPAILDQVQTIRALAPNAEISIAPITMNSPYPRPAADPRNHALFASAWCTRVVKYLSLAGVSPASFDFGGEIPVLQQFKPGDAKVLSTTITPAAPPSVDAFALDTKGTIVVWLVNVTDQPCSATVAVGDVKRVQLSRLNEKTPTKFTTHKTAPENGQLTVPLLAFEVCRITLTSAR